MKKLFTILTVALMAVAVCSSCNKPKSLAKKTVKTTEKRLDEIDKILDKFDALTPAEKEEFVEYLVQQDWQNTLGKIAKLGCKYVRIAPDIMEASRRSDSKHSKNEPEYDYYRY